MATLILVHNPDFAGEIASHLRPLGSRTVICRSTAAAEFAKEFSAATLIVTDLAPSVLELLRAPVGPASTPLIEAAVPILVLASPGHCGTFATQLAQHGKSCIARDVDAGFAGRLCDAAARTIEAAQRTNPPETAVAAPPESSRTPIAIDAAPDGKKIAADQPHRPRGLRSRRLAARQDRFVSDIAHDLRTPLTAIFEFAHLMESGLAGSMSDQQQRYVGIIERRCQEASRMLDDLLDGARLQSGRIHSHRQPIDLVDVLTEVREMLEPAIRHGGVNVTLAVPDGLPRVFADRDMLGRIVANLVSNALKFTPPGGSIAMAADRQSVSAARVSVSDTGAGISREDMRRIFRRFERGATCSRDGVGLGLSIVRQLVKIQGGRVTAESTPGKGSRFHFTLPLFLPTALVRRRLAAVDRDAATASSIWSFTCGDASKYDAIHRLITATVSARDLVLPEDAGRRLLLITQTAKPELLIDRLKRQIAGHSVAVPLIRSLNSTEVAAWLGNETPPLRPLVRPPDTATLAG